MVHPRSRTRTPKYYDVYKLLTYTLRTPEALEDYATSRWPRHIRSLRTVGVSTHGIWTEHGDDVHRLIALISFPKGADPASVTAAYMAGSEFTADMEGFDVSDIVDVEERLLDPTDASPLP